VLRRAALAVSLALLASCLSAPERRAVAEEYYNLGNAHLAAGKAQRALSLFELAVRTDPSLLQAHYNLSLALLRVGRGEEAMSRLSALLERDPDNLMVLSLLGFAGFQLGRMEEALSRYDQVLARAPGDRDALYNRGLVLARLGRSQEAVQALQAVAARVPGDELALGALARIARIHRESGARDLEAGALERYVEWKPQDADVLLELAAAYRAQEKYLPSMDVYRRVSTLAPEKVEAWIAQAELLLTVVEDPEGGLQALERALRGGLEDRERLKALLRDERLQDREQVRLLISRWGLLEDARPAGGEPAGPTPAKP
jgi:tetratricopeptide (TPR) repeat protein